MDRDQLFLLTLNDLEERAASQNAYQILGISALFRKLYLDGFPLVDQANKTRGLKIKYTINERTPDLDEHTIFWSIQDGFDPNTSAFPKPIEVSRDQFLQANILAVKGKIYTVRDLILIAANVMGGVHPGKAKNIEEETLSQLGNNLSVGGLDPVLRSFLSINRVVQHGLSPLKNTILKEIADQKK
ncbi:hypothetical protein JYT60_00285 [bacterium AH-315-C08]|nr:hypothetical protein [bacterium AH-315-C08]